MARTLSPPYIKVKKYVLGRIISGDWKPSDRVPSDNELASTFKVSRLTANKAMRELADEGYVDRAPGIGTFVADVRSHGDLLRVTNIAEIVRNRSHEYDAQIIERSLLRASAEICAKFNLPVHSEIFHSVIVHLDQGIPIQLEDRYINRAVAPDFLSVDLKLRTPTSYLMEISPPNEVEQQVQAIMPTKAERSLLKMGAKEPCLLINRRTWIGSAVATVVRLYHPGSRFDLSGRWTPEINR